MPAKTKALALAWMWTGLVISLYMLAAAGIGIQLFVLTMGLVGTVTILFVVRTTAAEQDKLLEALKDGQEFSLKETKSLARDAKGGPAVVVLAAGKGPGPSAAEFRASVPHRQ